MKILLISPPWIDTPPKGYGGTELVISNLAESLIKMGHDVTLFATKKSKTNGKLKYVFAKGLAIDKTPWNAALPALLHYDQAFKLAEQEEFDIVHAQLSSQTDIIVLKYLSEIKTPAIMTIHGHWPFDVYSKMDNLYMKHYAKDIHAVNISKTMQGFMPKHFKSAGIVYNAINTDNFTFNAKPKNYLTWLGRIVEDKGLYDAIMVAKKTGEQLIFAGIPDLSTPKGKKYFENKIKPLIDGKQIKFIGEAGPKKKNDLLRNAKAFLNPIKWEEPFGLVMIESMACGTPVISYNRGAAKELIIDNKTGFLVKDIRGMIKAINKVDSIERSTCRTHVEKTFSMEAMAKGYAELYKKRIGEFIGEKRVHYKVISV